jgi:hypothetical protein
MYFSGIGRFRALILTHIISNYMPSLVICTAKFLSNQDLPADQQSTSSRQVTAPVVMMADGSSVM